MWLVTEKERVRQFITRLGAVASQDLSEKRESECKPHTISQWSNINCHGNGGNGGKISKLPDWEF